MDISGVEFIEKDENVALPIAKKEEEIEEEIEPEVEVEEGVQVETKGAPGKVEMIPDTKGQPPSSTPVQERQTSRYMTKYERARILGTRAQQISMGAPVLVELTNETDPLDIAMKELKHKRIPIIIRRYLPDTTYEDWTVDELLIEHPP